MIEALLRDGLSQEEVEQTLRPCERMGSTSAVSARADPATVGAPSEGDDQPRERGA